VIEDSATGVLAARAAGMAVFGYAADEDAAQLAAAGAVVFDAMEALPGLLGLA
jgi:beta-phosphoglucomutase-like phosphatase (HAD superfamily)